MTKYVWLRIEGERYGKDPVGPKLSELEETDLT